MLVISAILFPLASRRISRDNPGPLQHILEMTVSGLKGLLHEIIGHEGDNYLYIIGAFAVFIFLANIFGLFFFLQPPTSNPNTTFALALTSFLYFNYQGIRKQGFLHYLKHFAGPIWWLAPLMFGGSCYGGEVVAVRGDDVASWKRLVITVRRVRALKSA